MPLKPIVVDEPFTQWGLGFIGMINLTSSTGHRWILAAIDYFTRWTEAVPLRNAMETKILGFLEELVSSFGPSKTIISDNARAL